MPSEARIVTIHKPTSASIFSLCLSTSNKYLLIKKESCKFNLIKNCKFLILLNYGHKQNKIIVNNSKLIKINLLSHCLTSKLLKKINQ